MNELETVINDLTQTLKASFEERERRYERLIQDQDELIAKLMKLNDNLEKLLKSTQGGE